MPLRHSVANCTVHYEKLWRHLKPRQKYICDWSSAYTAVECVFILHRDLLVSNKIRHYKYVRYKHNTSARSNKSLLRRCSNLSPIIVTSLVSSSYSGWLRLMKRYILPTKPVIVSTFGTTPCLHYIGRYTQSRRRPSREKALISVCMCMSVCLSGLN